MSWAVSRSSVKFADLDDTLASMLKEANTQHPDAEDQIESAIDAAGSIIDAEAIGDTGKLFSISLSGHSNPGHEPVAGMANDCITVSVYQV